MKRIVIISTSFPSRILHSGKEAAGSFVYDFVHDLSRKAEVTVVAPGKTDSINRINGFSVRFFSTPALPLSLLKPENPLKWPAIFKTMNSGQKAAYTAINEVKPNHVLALWALPSGYWAKRACRKTGTPYSIWALGSDIWDLGRIPIVRQVLRSTLRSSSNCFADGYKLASDVTAISGKPCEFLPSCRRLPGRNTKNPATAPPYKLAFLGRWHRNKGIDLLLESLKFLSPEDWMSIQEIRVNGGGPLEKLVNAEGRILKERGYPVTIGGYLDTDQATDLYHWADYLLIPSRIESIPVVFSDAIQSNCPVVATPVGDLSHLISKNSSGILAEDVSAEAFAFAIRNALKSNCSDFENGINKMLTLFNVSRSTEDFLERVTYH